jgi:hypothetical protein
MKSSLRWGLSAVLAVGLCGTRSLVAQTDYRNVDEGRPTRVEDAFPVERYAFEFLTSYALEREPGGGVVHAFVPELEYGIVANGELGITAPIGMLYQGGVARAGLAGLRAFALYNFNTETAALPAVALRADVRLPAGSFAGGATRVTLKGIATRSWGRHRLHLNGAYTLGPDASPALVEPAERWWWGAALDRTLFRESLLLLAAVYAHGAARAAPTEVTVSLGVRWQWHPTAVIDIGLARGLAHGRGPDYAFTVGISNAFAFAGLVPGER